MDRERIQSALQDALEEEIPASQIDLWPAVKADLVAGTYQSSQQGEKMNNTKSQRVPRFAFALVIIAALLAIMLLTPQGRTFARSILQLFTRAESTTFPLQSLQIKESELASTASSDPTSMPPSPLISASEASDQAGFSAAELPYPLDGLEYLGARLYGKTINLEYQSPDKGGHLIIQQSQTGYLQSDWDQVPASAVIPVKIGILDGELVQGTFVHYPGETAATWNPDAPFLRLRWEVDGIWFEIIRHGYGKAVENLDQAALIELAEGLVNQP